MDPFSSRAIVATLHVLRPVALDYLTSKALAKLGPNVSASTSSQVKRALDAHMRTALVVYMSISSTWASVAANVGCNGRPLTRPTSRAVLQTLASVFRDAFRNDRVMFKDLRKILAHFKEHVRHHIAQELPIMSAERRAQAETLITSLDTMDQETWSFAATSMAGTHSALTSLASYGPQVPLGVHFVPENQLTTAVAILVVWGFLMHMPVRGRGAPTVLPGQAPALPPLVLGGHKALVARDAMWELDGVEERMLSVMSATFGFQSWLSEGQKRAAVTIATHAGSIFIVLTCGGGKSIACALPFMALRENVPGFALVVVPVRFLRLAGWAMLEV